ncbi:MAG TPA: hypothetical protein VHM19_18140, partial [Polyangiales bacterium]|nr:hypothetical protein [Polyangiales bacterium]
AATLSLASGAQAQIKSPGAHPHYSAEIEPHLVFEWSNSAWWNDDGIGVGVHGSIPVIDNGPVETINNNFAITFGLDWAHYGDCGPYNCGADSFLIPIAVQWNFFLSRVVSLFPELGLGIEHVSWNNPGPGPGFPCRVNGVNVCVDTSDTNVDLVLWLGARFLLSDSFALTVRLGTPSLLLGASFLL